MSKNSILIVDDESLVLVALEHQLRPNFAIRTAQSGDEALEIIQDDGPFAVVVSDMQMPGMSGIEFLSRVKTLYPDTVRILFTGHADLDSAIKAVNMGEIFRFLTKPCDTTVMEVTLTQALRQYELITAERDLLDQTLKSTVKVLCELLGLASATAFSNGHRIKAIVSRIVVELQLDYTWEFEIAALMSHIGCVTLPKGILNKINAGVDLLPDEYQMYKKHPGIGEKMISQIPRLENIAAMIGRQMEPWGALGPASELFEDRDVLMGGEILRVAIEYNRYLSRGRGHQDALAGLIHSEKKFSPDVLHALAAIKPLDESFQLVNLSFKDIVPGMIPDEDVVAEDGSVVIAKGEEITWPMIQGLDCFAEQLGVSEPIRVRVVLNDI